MPELNMHRHDADGQPYVAYYRNDAVTGFIWSGRMKDPVQVTREMGEPIIDTFMLTGGGGFVALPEFKRQCDRYLAQPMCAEGDQVNDDNPGRPICRTCDDDPAIAALYPREEDQT